MAEWGSDEETDHMDIDEDYEYDFNLLDNYVTWMKDIGIYHYLKEVSTLPKTEVILDLTKSQAISLPPKKNWKKQ